MSQIDEKFGKYTLKALGTVTGLSKKDYTGQNVPRGKRFRDNAVDFAQTAAASSAIMGNVSWKSFVIPASIVVSKAIAARRAIKEHEKLMDRKAQEREEMPKTVAEAIDNIINKDFEEANALLENCVKDLLVQKLFEMKKIYAARLSEQIVNNHGRVETATGESLLPSVYRHRRLNESATGYDFRRPSFKKAHEDAESNEEKYYSLRDAEISSATKGISREGKRTTRGPEKINDYKERKEEKFGKAGRKAVDTYPDDYKSAAQHMHKLLSGVENAHEPWMHSAGYDWDNLHPTVRNDFENHIKREMRQRENMKDPVKREKMRDRGQKKQEAKAKMRNTIKDQQNALKNFENKDKPKKKDTRPIGQRIRDEIPFLEEKVINAIDKAFSKKGE